MRKSKKKNYFLKLILFVLILSILLNVYLLIPPQADKLKLDNFEKVDVRLEGITLLLSKNCYVLPIYISLEQAESIRDGMNNKKFFRPNTHDLIVDSLKKLKVEIIGVKITELKNNTYYAKLVLRSNEKIIEIDSRPSDAIAIAVRVGAEIYINKDLLREYGINTCAGEEVEIREMEETAL